jgi:chaperonin GroEL
VRGEEEFTAAALAATGHARLSLILGEMFDLLGPHGYISVEKYAGAYLEREYLNGGRWQARLASAYFAGAAAPRRAALPDAHVAVFDGRVSDVEEVQPLLDIAAGVQPARLLLAAQEISGPALNALVAVHRQGKLKIIAAALARAGEPARADFKDLALLAGAQLLLPEAGRPLRSILASDLGRARRVEAGPEDLFVVSGRGSPEAVRQQIEALVQQAGEGTDEADERDEVRQRLARLAGSAAVLKIGAATDAERALLHQASEKGIRALVAAAAEGVVPGGGIAYLHCIPAVRQVAAPGDERLGVQAVARALEAPFRRILANARVEAPGLIQAEVLGRGTGWVYDVLHGEIARAAPAGILDPARVLRVALEAAASGAATCLSVDTLVLRRQPPVSHEP